MESKARLGPRQAEYCLPNTIVIQLMSSGQPQTKPISVRATAMPALLSGTKSTVQQPQRPTTSTTPALPCRTRCQPVRNLQSSACPPCVRRKAPTDECRCSPSPTPSPQGRPGSNGCNNQLPGQGRTSMWTEYVYHPKETMMSISSPPPPSPARADLKEAGVNCYCHNCRFGRKSIPERENFRDYQMTTKRLSEIPYSPPGGRRDQSPLGRADLKEPGVNCYCHNCRFGRKSISERENYMENPYSPQGGRRNQSSLIDEQAQHLESLKTIGETLGQAIVTAAMASVKAVNRYSSSCSDSTPDLRPSGTQRISIGAEQNPQLHNPHSFLRTAFQSQITLLGDQIKKEQLHSPNHESMLYPKTPIETPLRIPKSTDRMPSGSTPGAYARSYQSETEGLPEVIFSRVNQTSNGVKVQPSSPSIRRLYPTDNLPPVKPKPKKSGPTSPSAAMPLTQQQSEAEEDLSPDLTVVTLPPDPDLASYSQTDDPYLSNQTKILSIDQ